MLELYKGSLENSYSRETSYSSIICPATSKDDFDWVLNQVTEGLGWVGIEHDYLTFCAEINIEHPVILYISLGSPREELEAEKELLPL